ncbi:MAG: hypothetical protein ACOZBL_00745 [Patescibacteria group bacterium]
MLKLFLIEKRGILNQIKNAGIDIKTNNIIEENNFEIFDKNNKHSYHQKAKTLATISEYNQVNNSKYFNLFTYFEETRFPTPRKNRNEAKIIAFT